MIEQEQNLSLERIAEAYEHVVVDTSIVSPCTHISVDKMGLMDLAYFQKGISRFREVFGRTNNVFFTEGVAQEVTGLVNKLKYLRRKSKRNSDEKELFKELTDNLVLIRKRIRKRVLRKFDKEIYGSLLSLVDEISSYVGERFPRFDIRKENSKTDEEIIACAYTLSLQNRGNTAIVSSDKGIREISNILGRALVMERFNPYNYDLVDSLIYDAPIETYKRSNGSYNRASEIVLEEFIDYEELADSLSIENIAKLSSVVPGREFVQFPEVSEEERRKVREIREMYEQDISGRKQRSAEAS